MDVDPGPEVIDLCGSEGEDPSPPLHPAASNPLNSFPSEDVIAECTICTRCFSTTKAFLDHMTIYHRFGELHECAQCHQYFMSEFALTYHMNMAHSVSVIQPSASTEHLVRQVRTSAAKTTVKSFSCEICEEKFQFQESLDQHKYVHTMEKKYSVVADLENETPPVKNFTCSICLKKFFVEKAMLMHKNRKHKLLLRIDRSKCCTYVCKTCGKSFPRAKNLLIHESWHGRAPRRKTRQLVGMVNLTDGISNTDLPRLRNFSHSKTSRRRNNVGESSTASLRTCGSKVVQNVIVKPKLFHCGICDREFSTNKGLVVHNRWHSKMSTVCESVGSSVPTNESTVSDYYLCKFCNKEFIYLFLYQQHVEKSHTVEKTIICQICGECFGFQTSLETHELFEHCNKQLMFCRLCTRPFTDILSLNNHFKSCYQSKTKNMQDSQHLQSKEISSNVAQSCIDSSNQTTPNKVTSAVSLTSQLNENQMRSKEVTSTVSFTNRKTTLKKTQSSKVATLRSPPVRFSVLRERIPKLLNRGPIGSYFSCNLCNKFYKREERLIHHIILEHSAEEFPFSANLRKSSPPPHLHFSVSKSINIVKPAPPQSVHPFQKQISSKSTEPQVNFSLASGSSVSTIHVTEELSDPPTSPVSENLETPSIDCRSDMYQVNLWEP